MGNPIKTLLVGSVITGLVTITAFQQSEINDFNTVLEHLRHKVAEQNDIIVEQEQELDELRTRNTNLVIQLDLVRDSLRAVKHDLAIAKRKYQRSQKSLAAVKKELDVRQKELAFVKESLKKLQKAKSNSKREQELKKQVAALQKQVEQLQYLKEQSQEQVETRLEEVRQEDDLANKLRQIRLVLEGTKTEYKAISLRTERDGDDITSLKHNGRNWKYTVVNLDLQNAVPGVLVGQQFELRIVDSDTGEPLSFIESNPIYPDADDNIGLRFTYPGHPQELVFINTEPKDGENYEIKLFYVLDGQTYYVNNSTRQIIFDAQPF